MSNPTIDQQWETFKTAIITSGINMEVVDEVLVALLKLTDAGGYGKINISVAGGLIQELRVETSKRMEKLIVKP